MYKYPVYQPELTGNEKKYVIECLDTTWISSKGRFVSEFESKFCEYVEVGFASGVSNGTVAIHLALAALGIGPGDEVIVPTFTYIASANPVRQLGATPVFADSLEDTWQVDPADVERKITPKTKAVIAVHLYGHPCDMDELCRIARERGLFLIEDCAEALGSLYKGKHVGTFGDVGTFSFFGNKTITTGEGGMVVTNDEKLYVKLCHLKGQGLAKHREYWHDAAGYNYRMTNIEAAIGLAQLEKIDDFVARKQRVSSWYREGLQDSPVIYHEGHGDVFHSYWMCSVLVRDASERDELRKVLKETGIETRPTFYPVHKMPMYYSELEFPVADDIAYRGINLPSYPGLGREDVEFICRAVKGFYEH